MAEKGGEVIILKVLFDKKKERVVFAESDNHFIDILFSFLTLPLGTIIKLLRTDQPKSTVLGSMTTLYKSIENLDVQYFRKEWCQHVLLHLKNPSQSQCRRLKLNIDNTEPIKYFLCEHCYKGPNALLRIYPSQTCKCRKMMSKEMYSVVDIKGCGKDDSKGVVFVKESGSTFIITDDLQVIPSSATSTVELFPKLGVKEVNSLKEKTLNFGIPEFLALLRLSLVSKSPLTDMIMMKHLESSSMVDFRRDIKCPALKATTDTFKGFKNMIVKVVFRKSKKKLLFVEANKDFVNFLFILPSIVIGSIVNLLDSSPSLGCISNLSKRVKGLSSDGYIKSEDIKDMLLSPKLGVQFGYYTSKPQMTNMLNDEVKTIDADTTFSIATNPECTVERMRAEKIVEGPDLYIVSDDLTVTPMLSSTSVLDYLDQVSARDLEIREVSFGKEKARKLLEASLISKAALSIALNFNVSRSKLMFNLRKRFSVLKLKSVF